MDKQNIIIYSAFFSIVGIVVVSFCFIVSCLMNQGLQEAIIESIKVLGVYIISVISIIILCTWAFLCDYLFDLDREKR